MRYDIYLEGGIATPELAQLSKKAKDTANWISLDTAYKVNFGRSSPFSKKVFDVPALGSKESGAIRGNAAKRKYGYKPFPALLAKKRGVKARKKKVLAGGPDVEILP